MNLPKSLDVLWTYRYEGCVAWLFSNDTVLPCLPRTLKCWPWPLIILPVNNFYPASKTHIISHAITGLSTLKRSTEGINSRL
jgi:hypothetical protein